MVNLQQHVVHDVINMSQRLKVELEHHHHKRRLAPRKEKRKSNQVENVMVMPLDVLTALMDVVKTLLVERSDRMESNILDKTVTALHVVRITANRMAVRTVVGPVAMTSLNNMVTQLRKEARRRPLQLLRPCPSTHGRAL
jgi:hypothetical protein